MIRGKASILQKTRLLGLLRPARGLSQAEAADAHLACQTTPVAMYLGVGVQCRVDEPVG